MSLTWLVWQYSLSPRQSLSDFSVPISYSETHDSPMLSWVSISLPESHESRFVSWVSSSHWVSISFYESYESESPVISLYLISLHWFNKSLVVAESHLSLIVSWVSSRGLKRLREINETHNTQKASRRLMGPTGLMRPQETHETNGDSWKLQII